jgi:hypothetical protein
MAVLALFAFAGSASAITCTIDQRPAATLLVPYFAVSINDDATVKSGTPDSFDTLIALGNASQAPTIAHVAVWNARSTLVLDFNVALTGFDIQSWRMSDILSGILPSTPVGTDHTGPNTALDPLDDVCQRNALAAVYPDPDGYLRVRTTGATNQIANPDDNRLATAAYVIPQFDPSSDFAKVLVDSLDDTEDARNCDFGGPIQDLVDGITSGPAVGYVTIDMVNYCTLANPNDPSYYISNALGGENNLFGDIIFTSNAGIGTYGMGMVAIESDPSFSSANQADDVRMRTFYARYWAPSQITGCPNCVSGVSEENLATRAPWDVLQGDQREPLGLRYAARYFVGPAIISSFDVWRASSNFAPNGLANLEDGGDCDTQEPPIQLAFFDEDENTVTIQGPGPCPSPCTVPTTPAANFPFETQKVNANQFTLPSALPGGNQVGWVAMNFDGTADPTNLGSNLDQAWVAYEFHSAAAFVSSHIAATQLDPSNCEPLGLPDPLLDPDILPVTPVIPGGVLGDGNPPAGTGPIFVPTS